MPQLIVGLLLDDGGRQFARAFAGLAVVALMALLLTVTIPVAFVAGSGVATAPGAPRSGPQPPTVLPPLAAVPQPPIAVPPTSTGPSAVEVARRFLGVPYVFGGSNPATGLDCSGLVQLVFRQLGISLPRTAQLQYEATPTVPQDQLQPGDLVFFARTYADPRDWITHVGIYIGGGLQIDAPTEGQVVSIQPVFSGFWGAHYAGAGRPRAA
jgi:cell wall-associated NlpC family hydrolase